MNLTVLPAATSAVALTGTLLPPSATLQVMASVSKVPSVTGALSLNFRVILLIPFLEGSLYGFQVSTKLSPSQTCWTKPCAEISVKREGSKMVAFMLFRRVLRLSSRPDGYDGK